MHRENCDLCANNILGRGHTQFFPEPGAFRRDGLGTCGTNGKPAEGSDVDALVRAITEQVMATLNGRGV